MVDSMGFWLTQRAQLSSVLCKMSLFQQDKSMAQLYSVCSVEYLDLFSSQLTPIWDTSERNGWQPTWEELWKLACLELQLFQRWLLSLSISVLVMKFRYAKVLDLRALQWKKKIIKIKPSFSLDGIAKIVNTVQSQRYSLTQKEEQLEICSRNQNILILALLI